MLLRQALAILILPFTVTVIIPFLLLRDGAGEPAMPFRTSGVILFVLGLFLAANTIWHFVTRGRGTLAPWDPTRRLVTSGIYRYARNPMITGVFLILLGESLWFASGELAVWAAVFFTINAAYIPLVEEKGLVDRFGAEYETYKRHVPRWVPRVSPWDGKDLPGGV
jgi:protein-S-isoprenylcysteine O-methyltransferase Ste14